MKPRNETQPPAEIIPGTRTVGSTVRQYPMRESKASRWLDAYAGKATYFETRKSKSTPSGTFSRENASQKTKLAKGLLVIICFAAFALLALPFGTLYVSRLVINDVTVEGSSPYSTLQLLDAAGYEIGGKLLAKTPSAAAADAKETLGYLKKCRIKIKLPDTLCFTVESYETSVYTRIAGEYYVIADDMTVIERNGSELPFKARGLIYCELPEVTAAVVGGKLQFSGKNDTAYIASFISGLRNAGLLSRVNEIRLDRKFDISLIMDGKHEVRIGSPTDTVLKLRTAVRAAEETEKVGTMTGRLEIDVSDPDRTCVTEINTAFSGG